MRCEKNRNEKKMQSHADKYNCIIFNQAVKKIWDNTSFASSSSAVFWLVYRYSNKTRGIQ